MELHMLLVVLLCVYMRFRSEWQCTKAHKDLPYAVGRHMKTSF